MRKLLVPLLCLLASPALAAISAAERDYHAKVFDYAMATLKAGGKYDWKSNESSGVIHAGEPFVSPSKSTCRPYSEQFDFSGQQGQIAGYACRREGREGWCRLKNDTMLSCALEPPDDFLGEAIQAGNDMLRDTGTALRNSQTRAERGANQVVDDTNASMDRTTGRIKRWWDYWTPW